MKDLNGRIQQLTKLILTSQTLDETRGDELRSSSPVKVDFDMSPYKVSRPPPTHTSFQSHFRINNYTLIQLQQELLTTRRELETRSNRILSLEAALLARPELPADHPKRTKD